MYLEVLVSHLVSILQILCEQKIFFPEITSPLQKIFKNLSELSDKSYPPFLPVKSLISFSYVANYIMALKYRPFSPGSNKASYTIFSI
jgi:hypothetical protein